MSINSVSIIQKFRPKLVAEAVAKREAGETVDAVARFLSQKSGVTVGREALRVWFKDRETVEQTFERMPGVVEMEVIMPSATAPVHRDDPDRTSRDEPAHVHAWEPVGNGTSRCTCGQVK